MHKTTVLLDKKLNEAAEHLWEIRASWGDILCRQQILTNLGYSVAWPQAWTDNWRDWFRTALFLEGCDVRPAARNLHRMIRKEAQRRHEH